MKAFYISLLIFALMLVFSTLLVAQPGLPNPPAQAPIDGGLGILAAAGGTYALKKLRDRRRAEQEAENEL